MNKSLKIHAKSPTDALLPSNRMIIHNWSAHLLPDFGQKAWCDVSEHRNRQPAKYAGMSSMPNSKMYILDQQLKKPR